MNIAIIHLQALSFIFIENDKIKLTGIKIKKLIFEFDFSKFDFDFIIFAHFYCSTRSNDNNIKTIPIDQRHVVGEQLDN